jgi:prephenate dehydrogenase
MITSVAIIGAGKMGLWFCNYFSKKDNYYLMLYDERKINLSLKKFSYKLTICKTLDECVKKADMVIVCVPIKTTFATINKCLPIMKKGSCIVEISSLKMDIFDSLLKVPDYITPISIHPMFGPGAKKLQDMKILVVPVRNKKIEEKIIKSTFNEAKIIVIKDPRKHDSFMAVILGMVYYVNLLIAFTLDNENISSLKKISGTTFYLQSLIFESILTDNPSLISSLLIQNHELIKYLRKYVNESKKLFDIIMSNDSTKLEKKIKEIKIKYGSKSNTNSSYEKMYSLIARMNRN